MENASKLISRIPQSEVEAYFSAMLLKKKRDKHEISPSWNEQQEQVNTSVHQEDTPVTSEVFRLQEREFH